MTDLYAIGELLIDFIPGNEPDSYLRRAGGAPANVAVAAVKNGLSAGMCCKVGEDFFGHFLFDTLKEQGVDTKNVHFTEEAVTTLAFVSLLPDGDRLFTFARKPGADTLLCESDVLEEDIEDCVIVHAGSCSMSNSPAREATTKALKLAHEKGKLVSFDVNYRNVMWQDDEEKCRVEVEKILPYVDILKISDVETGFLGGEGNIPVAMEQYGLTAVAETLGADGSRLYFRSETADSAIKIYNQPGEKVKAIDTTGAGDAFWGAFLSSLRRSDVTKAEDLTEEILKEAMACGGASGSLCVLQKGAIGAIPMWEEIKAHRGI